MKKKTWIITENEQTGTETDLIWSVQHDEDQVKSRQQRTAHSEQITRQWFLHSSVPPKHLDKTKINSVLEEILFFHSDHFFLQYPVVTNNNNDKNR